MNQAPVLHIFRFIIAVAAAVLVASLVGFAQGADPPVPGSSAAAQAQLVTRPIPITLGRKEFRVSPFYITLLETRYDKPALAALSGASQDSPDFVAHRLMSAMSKNDQALFRELTVAEEQNQATETLNFLRGFGAAGAALQSRFDLGVVSLYLLLGKTPQAPLVSFILKRTADGYRQSFQMTQHPLCATVIALAAAHETSGKSFAAVGDKAFEHRLPLGPLVGDSPEPAVTISFERGCKTSCLTYDKEIGDALGPANTDCGDAIRDVLQFDRHFWARATQKKYDELLAALDAGQADRLKQLRARRGDDVLAPQLRFNRREVKYVVASKDAYVLFSWTRLYAARVQAMPTKIQPDIVSRSPENKWQMLHYNSSTSLIDLLTYRPLLSQIEQLAAE